MKRIADVKTWLGRFAADVNILPVYCLVIFVVLNAFKIAAFDRLIVDTEAFPRFPDIVGGYLVKLVLAAVCTTLLLRVRWRLVFSMFYLVQSVYLLVNLMYFHAFQGYLHISQYTALFAEAFDLVTHAALPWDARTLFVFADLPFLAVILLTFRRLNGINRRYLFRPVLYGASLLLLVAFCRWDPPAGTPLREMDDQYESDVSIVKRYGLLTFNVMDLVSLRDAHAHIADLKYGPPVSARDTGGARPNLCVIQVESLDAYVLHQRHRGKYVTPFLHALADSSVFFPYMLSYHLAGSTSDCEFSVMNSVEPLSDFPSMKIRSYDFPNSFIKRCAANGYATVVFHGNRGTYFNRNFGFKKMGFQRFYDMFAMGIPEMGWGITDDTVFDFAAARLAEQKQPFLYYIITMSSHEPFTLIKPYYRDTLFDDIRDGAVRNYFNSMSYVDSMLRQFIGTVRRTCPNTVIFILGDHTPTMPQCGYAQSMVRLNNRRFEFVPLFIITPGGTRYRETGLAASLLDIAPTVLAAGRCSGELRTYGTNLLAGPQQDRAVPFRGDRYSRSFLFSAIERKR